MHPSHYQVLCSKASRSRAALQASRQLSRLQCLRLSRSAAPGLSVLMQESQKVSNDASVRRLHACLYKTAPVVLASNNESASRSPSAARQGLHEVCMMHPHLCACLQTSATAGTMKEELNNTLLACLAEEAKSAHAAQEAIEFCRAAGLLHSTHRMLAPPHASLSLPLGAQSMGEKLAMV